LTVELFELARTLTERALDVLAIQGRLDWSGAAALAAQARFADVAGRLRQASIVVGWGLGTDPRQVAVWWAGLSMPERDWLVANRPGLVGALDGVPAVDRDAANRLILAREQNRNPGLTAIADRLADPALPRAYLLQLDPAGDGRAVVAIGDPDHATDVLVEVPGAGASLAGMASLIGRADAVLEAAARLGPDHRLVTVAWLGYDPPDGADAALTRAADGGRPALDSFVDGLRATHQGAPAHTTVLGHSYGSLTVGVTAHDRGLDADDLIFVGSPGVGVDSASALGVDEVWSSTAANDPVQRYAPGPGQLAVDALDNALRPFAHHVGDADPDAFLWHGVNPSHPAFGGHVFASDPDGGHNGYWRGTGLDNIARIALDQSPQDQR
jgi:hypothetical protein